LDGVYCGIVVLILVPPYLFNKTEFDIINTLYVTIALNKPPVAVPLPALGIKIFKTEVI
jgi:hypothetical protein